MPRSILRDELPRAGTVARRDVPRCGLGERIGEVRKRVEADDWDLCVVVNEEEVVLGLLRARELGADSDATVEQVMRSGPATYRPDTLLTYAVERLRKRDVQGVLVTRSDGTLIGWLRREDAERAVEG